MQILFLDEFTGYGFGVLASQVLARELRKRGVDVHSVNPANPHECRQLLKRKEGFDLVFSFSGRSLTHKIENEHWHTYFGAPLFCPFGDHPLYKAGFVDYTLPDVTYGFNDPSHAEFMRSRHPECSDQYIHFPHFPLFPIPAGSNPVVLKQKRRRIFFAGNAHIMFRQTAVHPHEILTASEYRTFYHDFAIPQRLQDELANNSFQLD